MPRYRLQSLLTVFGVVTAVAVCGGREAAAQQPAPGAPAAVPVPAAEPAAPADAGRPARERLIAKRIALSTFDPEILWLDAADGPFLALHRPARQPLPAGGLVITSAAGSVVDDAPALRALAYSAVAGGWSVLSLQPPAAPAQPAAAQSRITAALRYFSGLGVGNIILASDGDAAADTLAALASNASPAVVGFAGIGAFDHDLAGLEVAILDVAGSRDLRAVRWQARRKALARDYPSSIETVLIDGAGPRFRGYADMTANRVRGWLGRAAPAVAVTR